ncbi:MAG TPA: copper chaperone PCu(A)C [Acidimicrobiia bacterium]|nr:copper chaperone PCu(A)C [Acidimicrobiia bacterium]
MRRLRSLSGSALLIGVLSTACAADSGPITVDGARIGEPTGPNAALYLTATSNGGPDRLVGAHTVVADVVEIHRTTIDGDGVIAMERADSLDLPAAGSLVLEPGGLHVMLVDVDRLEAGDVVEVTLIWETAGEMTVEAEIVEPADTMSHER